jgi:hypothetical protein
MNREELIKNAGLEGDSRFSVFSQKGLDNEGKRRIDKIVTEDKCVESLYELIKEWESNGNYPFTDVSIQYAIELLLKAKKLKQVHRIFILLNKKDFHLLESAYLLSLSYAIENDNNEFLNNIFKSFIIWLSNFISHEGGLATDPEYDIIELLMKAEKKELLMDLFKFCFDNNYNWYFMESFDFMLGKNNSFTISFVNEFIEKYPNYVPPYTIQFLTNVFKDQTNEAKAIISQMNNEKKINEFLSLIVENFIIDNDSFSEKTKILNAFKGFDNLSNRIKNKIEVYTFPIIEEILKNHQTELEETRLNERNKIMANLSHTVKNMLSSVIDPLEKIKETGEAKPVVVDNAIRGANLIRSLVNAMNLSFKGSLEDFIYDVQNNTYENSSTIEGMFIESLKQSISTTFDGKYFKKFVDKFSTATVFGIELHYGMGGGC